MSDAVFLRSQASVLTFDLCTNEQYCATFIGFVADTTTFADLTTTTNWKHYEEAVYFHERDIRLYSDHDNSGVNGASEQGSNALGADVWNDEVDTFWRVRITLKPAGGARYEVFKNGDYTQPFSSYDTTGNTKEKMRVAVMVHFDTGDGRYVIFNQLGVNAPIQSTRISGNSISTGVIKSSNQSSTATYAAPDSDGTIFDLNQGQLLMMKSSNRIFDFDSQTSTAKIGGFSFSDTTFTGDGTTSLLKTNSTGTRVEIGGASNGCLFYEINQVGTEVLKLDISTDSLSTTGYGQTGFHVHPGDASVHCQNGMSLINTSAPYQDDSAGSTSTINTNRVWSSNIFIKDMSLKDSAEGGDGSITTANEQTPNGTSIQAATANVLTYTINSTDTLAGASTEIDTSTWIASTGTMFMVGSAPKSGIASVYQPSGAPGLTGVTAGPERYHAAGYFEMADLLHNAGDKSTAIFARHYTSAGYTFRGVVGKLWNRHNILSDNDVIAFASDKRLKENIFIIEDPIEKIKKLRGVNFDWKELTKEEGFEPARTKNEVGVIAQEVEVVIPQAVYTAPFDENYKGTDREKYKTVKLEKIVPLLIEGIKEQQNTIEDLETRIKKLENK